jgi:hypothetical protein
VSPSSHSFRVSGLSNRMMRSLRSKPWAPLISLKVIRWLLFGVAFATLPIVASYLVAVTQNVSPGMNSILGRGELLIVSAAVAATGAGELQGEAIEELRRFQVFVSAMAYLVVCISSLWFASVTTSVAGDVAINEHAIALGSIVTFVAAVIVGASCVALTEVK